MTETIDKLAAEAMNLPAESRARLADLLVESLDQAELGELDRAWAEVAKQRRDALRSGQAKAIPGTDALQQVRDALKR